MKANLTIIAKSDKHTGYCVAAMDEKGKIIRLVRDKEGHALTEEQCGFKKLDRILVNITHAPLKHQRENYILNELLDVRPPILVPDGVVAFLQSRHTYLLPRILGLPRKRWHDNAPHFCLRK